MVEGISGVRRIEPANERELNSSWAFLRKSDAKVNQKVLGTRNLSER
jgi:hypothetical protein